MAAKGREAPQGSGGDIGIEPTTDCRLWSRAQVRRFCGPPKVVSERFGHATVSITLDTYSHAIPAMQEEAAALIASLVLAAE
jgi:hypothetical protein